MKTNLYADNMKLNTHLDLYNKKLFHPDLLIEVTSVCDRACRGCYAANFVSNKSKEQLYVEQKSLFLDIQKLEDSLATVSCDQIAIRGGEPTRHPYLDKIIEITSKHCRKLYLETHGRWIDSEENNQFLKSIANTGTILKISFDSMHGLKNSKLRDITDKLVENTIPFFIAITEVDGDKFLETRKLCHWVSDENIIFQLKASKLEELLQPSLGVLSVSGKISNKLNVRESFL